MASQPASHHPKDLLNTFRPCMSTSSMPQWSSSFSVQLHASETCGLAFQCISMHFLQSMRLSAAPGSRITCRGPKPLTPWPANELRPTLDTNICKVYAFMSSFMQAFIHFNIISIYFSYSFHINSISFLFHMPKALGLDGGAPRGGLRRAWRLELRRGRGACGAARGMQNGASSSFRCVLKLFGRYFQRFFKDVQRFSLFFVVSIF